MNFHAMVLLWLVIYIAQSFSHFPPALEYPLPRLQYGRELLLAWDTLSPPADLGTISFDGFLAPALRRTPSHDSKDTCILAFSETWLSDRDTDADMEGFGPPIRKPHLCAEMADSGTPNHNYDLSGSALTRLYNSPVYKAERMKRPLDGTSFVLGPISHSGVRVTLADGAQWLIHKGDDYGVSSQTVVTDARHMSSDWRVVQTAEFNGRKTVADFVATGGSEYSLLFDNCHMGSNRMMDQ
ncbi:uncharacterized protein LOC124065402 [Xyrichtys novacula]|uniref:Uncharacterized protein LOC124065402 n=1 Tax=Xyrichtys novacula TaxID=13765 RepID=A0AAV1FKY5_XYRNO|nr:uncharacterized protein LOC124065402 [Xyrichtys novacula]